MIFKFCSLCRQSKSYSERTNNFLKAFHAAETLDKSRSQIGDRRACNHLKRQRRNPNKAATRTERDKSGGNRVLRKNGRKVQRTNRNRRQSTTRQQDSDYQNLVCLKQATVFWNYYEILSTTVGIPVLCCVNCSRAEASLTRRSPCVFIISQWCVQCTYKKKQRAAVTLLSREKRRVYAEVGEEDLLRGNGGSQLLSRYTTQLEPYRKSRQNQLIPNDVCLSIPNEG